LVFKLEEGWLTVALLAAMVTVAAWGIAASSWAEGLWAAWLVGVIGVLAGLALAKSRFKGFTAAIFALVYGLFCVGFFVSLILKGTWHERSLELVTRIGTFIYKALFGGTSRDALPFPVFVGLIFWTLGAWGAWSVFRRGAVWPAILPAGVGLMVNAYYYLGPARIDLYLAVYVVLALMLLARMSLLAREREWRRERVAFSPDARLEFLRATLVVALAGVLIGWAAPSVSASPTAAATWQEMTHSWSAIRETWMRLFAAVRAYGSAVNDFYGDSLTLGGPARLTDDPVMDITVGPLDEIGPEAEVIPVARYYWRAVTWDAYDDGRWIASGAAEFKEFDPQNADVRLPAYRLRRDVSAVVISHVPASSKLYVPPQPKWVDRPANFELILGPGGVADVIAVRSRDILRQGEVYRAISSVSVADVASLRASATDYPPWILDAYLQVPDSITQRTRDLAQQIVDEAGARNPYDRAQAITDWLRANITYSQEIEAPPPDVDPIDYLLFTSKRGYCNYYASAEVIMLRSLGIPARLAAGFAQGKFDPQTGVYHVLQNDAHAWPEVFFAEYGWVEFEPTASQPPLERPERRSDAGATNENESPDADERTAPVDPNRERPERDEAAGQASSPAERFLAVLRSYGLTALAVLGVAAVAAAAAGALLLRAGLIGWENFGRLGRWVLRTRGQPIPTAIAAAYMQLERAARWLGLSLSAALTPHERAAALAETLPEARAGVETITDQYVTEQYSPHSADSEAARTAWLGMRLRVWREGLQRFIRSWTEDDLAKASRALRSKR
jgi:transglutaminase-like putative cysteine protease